MKKYGAYFTVEAALVLPMVFSCILVIIYLGIYQYDRCALEQNLNLITLLAVSENAACNEERVKHIQEYAAKLEDRYLAYKMQNVNFQVEKGKFINEWKGTVEFPFRVFLFADKESLWQLKVESCGQILNPVSFIRSYRKIKSVLNENGYE